MQSYYEALPLDERGRPWHWWTVTGGDRGDHVAIPPELEEDYTLASERGRVEYNHDQDQLGFGYPGTPDGGTRCRRVWESA